MTLSTDSQFFEHEMAVNGIQPLLFPSFEAAKKSGKEYSLVYLPNNENGRFDIYLTAIKNGEFGEYVCWVESEFEEDEELIHIVIQYITEAYGYSNAEERLRTLNPNIYFKPYDNQ